MPIGSVLLSLRSVSRVYRMGEVDVTALASVTLDLHRGEFVVVAGPSGSGKTTLLNLVGGLDRPTSGEVHFGDLDLSRAGEDVRTLYRRRHVGFVFQFYNLIPSLTARENIAVAAEIVDDPVAPDEALERVGLLGHADHFPAQLSGGEQQRVSIARALAKNPSFLLCDEPTGALDIETGKRVLRLLSDLCERQGKTVVLITHNTVIGEMADRVVVLRDGAVREVRENTRRRPPEELEW